MRIHSSFLALTILALLASLSPTAQAHNCGPSLVKVKVRDFAYFEITADVVESEKSSYELTGTPPNPDFAKVSPASPFHLGFPFETYSVGVYKIVGVSVGTTTMTARWSYAPNGASNNCPVTIEILPAFDDVPATNEDDENSGEASDPVNTFSGELFNLYPPDLRVDGPLPLEFQRYYASSLRRNASRAGTLGTNWLHNYEMWLARDGDTIDIRFRFGKTIRFAHDGSSWVRERPALPAYGLRESGSQLILLDPTDQRRYVFDERGRIATIKDANDNTLTVTYTDGNEGEVPAQVTDGLGRSLTFQYQGLNALAQVSDGVRTIGFSQGFAGPSDRHLTAITDAASNATQYDYAPTSTAGAGMLTSTVLPEGNRPFSQSFDVDHRVAEQADSEANVTQFDYSAAGTTITDPDLGTTIHTHDAAGRLTDLQNPAGDTRTTGYATMGRPASVQGFAGDSNNLTWHPASGYVATATDESGRTISFDYTARTDTDGFTCHDLTQVSYPDTTTETWTRDARGNALTFTDRMGDTWTWTYNSRGQRLTETNPLGGTTTYTYGTDGALASSTDPAGNATTFQYDALNRITGVTLPDASTRLLAHTPDDNLVSYTDERGKVTSFAYDTNGNNTTVTDAALGVTTYAYDGNGRIQSITDATGNTVTTSYDAMGRSSSDVNSNSDRITYHYDSRGNPIEVIDVAGESWSFGYDSNNALASVTDPTGRSTNYGRNGAGEITTITHPDGEVTTLAFDSAGVLTTWTDPLGRATEFTRDGRDDLASIRLAGAGVESGMLHNALGLLTRYTDPNDSDWQFAYDAQGRLTSSADPLGRSTTYGYDTRNRISSVQYPGGLGTQTLAYDAVGHLTRRMYSDGTDISYAYDDLGRLTGTANLASTYDAEGRMTHSNGLTLTRDPATGRLTRVRYSPTFEVVYQYDAQGRLSGIDDGLGGLTTFGHDAAGRRTSITRPNGVPTQITYDLAGRIDQITHGALASIALTRDAAGQVSGATRTQPLNEVPVASLSQTVDAALQVSDQTFDALGRIASGDGTQYTFDLGGRLTARDVAGDVSTYAFDGLDRLVQATSQGDVRDVTWNYGLEIPGAATLELNGLATYHYVNHPDGRLLYRVDLSDNSRHFFHFDEMGNTILLTGGTGQVVASYAYAPHGERAHQGTHDTLFTFGGELGVISEGPSLYFMGVRAYDAGRMRFLSRDPQFPHVHPSTFHPYTYASGNPLLFVDPFGDKPGRAEEFLGIFNDVVLSKVSSTLSLLPNYANLKLNAARKDTVAIFRRLASGQRPIFGELIKAASNQTKAQKFATQTGKLGNLGAAVTFLGGLFEVYKLNNRLGEHSSDWKRRTEASLNLAELQTQNAFRSYKAGNINDEELKRRLKVVREILDEALAAENGLYRTSVAVDTTNSVTDFAAGFVPFVGGQLKSGLLWLGSKLPSPSNAVKTGTGIN